MYNNHRILIDELIEYEYNGDMALTKKICTVVRYEYDDEANDVDECETATPMIFNVSPYTGLMDMDIMVKVWIDCGCPNDNGRKWTKDSLHAWVAA
tara:strand:+ start:198 stop:485 length:288 start_codon:yes stop_codon:yes gene_type:complete